MRSTVLAAGVLSLSGCGPSSLQASDAGHKPTDGGLRDAAAD